MAIISAKTVGSFNTRASFKSGGDIDYGPLFGTLGSGTIESKFTPEQIRQNTSDITNQAPYSNDLWLDVGTDPVRLLPNANESRTVLGLQNVLFVNKGSPDIYIYINDQGEGIFPSPSGALILASGESYLYEDILANAVVHMDPAYSGSGHIYAVGQTPYNHNTM